MCFPHSQQDFKEEEFPERRLSWMEQGKTFLEESGREEKMKTRRMETHVEIGPGAPGWWWKFKA